MNIWKYLMIILSIISKSNIISMQQESSLSSFPDELVLHIINQAILPQVKEFINNSYNDIFNEPKKVNLKAFKGFRDTSGYIYDLINGYLKSEPFNNIIDNLKQKRFDELFEDLKYQSIQKYKGLPTEYLNKILYSILDTRQKISKEDFKKAINLILAGANVNTK